MDEIVPFYPRQPPRPQSLMLMYSIGIPPKMELWICTMIYFARIYVSISLGMIVASGALALVDERDQTPNTTSAYFCSNTRARAET